MGSIRTSVLFKKNFVVQQVLKVDMWASQTSFTSFHQRDVTHRNTDSSSIGPVIAKTESCNSRHTVVYSMVILTSDFLRHIDVIVLVIIRPSLVFLLYHYCGGDGNY